MTMGNRHFGARVVRQEDPRLLSGKGRYLDDIDMPGLLHVAFVRSPEAHARIRGIDLSPARAMPGVVACFAAADLGPAALVPMAQLLPNPNLKQSLTYHMLAVEEVCHVGVAVAAVVAETRAQAEDAAARVAVDYQVLPAVVDWRRALDITSPLACNSLMDNRVAELSSRFGDIDGVFARAAHVVRERFEIHRGGCHSMETRGVIAAEDADGRLTVWTSTQAPYLVRRMIAEHLGRAERSVRVVTPDVGGGFGPKCAVYPEELALPLIAHTVGRPVKWVEDRREHFLSTTQQRDQTWDLEAAADASGRLLGVRGRGIHDNGAYVPYGLVCPVTSMVAFPGPYALEALDVRLDVVFTNTVPNTPVRGAGRPTACFVLERLADCIAAKASVSRADVRRLSFVRADQFPYETGTKARDGSPISYDSGDYHACLSAALERIGPDFAARQTAARQQGRLIGLGLASYIEDTGLAPFEGATVRVEPTGRVVILTGAVSQGQGHATAFAQICADQLGIGIDAITVEAGDTTVFPLGIGTIASRVAVVGGSSVQMASAAVRQKAIKVASGLLEAAEADLEVVDGAVHVVGAPGHKVTLAAIAHKLDGISGVPMPPGVEPGLAATAYYEARKNAFASGTHACEVEVDPETGEVRILRYVVAHDCGRLINPLLVDGQVIGGVVHGVGNALHERMVYDTGGQPVSMSYADYLLPVATDMVPIEIIHIETPSPLNPIGVKGAGEGGTIPAAACVIAAIENALAHVGVRLNEHPIAPGRLRALIAERVSPDTA